MGVARDNSRHRKDIDRLLKNPSKSASARSQMESDLGCRLLLNLPYFDPVLMNIIDPMHNLFHGSASHQRYSDKYRSASQNQFTNNSKSSQKYSYSSGHGPFTFTY